MKALEVFVNGERICLAGVGEDGVLNAIVNCVSTPRHEDPEERLYLNLHVGGLECASHEHVRWNSPEITVGSEILVRVIESEVVDPPDERVFVKPKTRREEYREYLRICSAKLSQEERKQLSTELIAELQSIRSQTSSD